MSYNTPYLNNYTNYMNRYSYIPQYQQPILPQMQPIQQPIQQTFEVPIQAVKFVNEAEAKAYIVMPNTKELLIDRNNKVAYLKSADMTGQSSSVVYKFDELKEDTKKDAPSFVTEEKAKSFVTKDEFDKLNKQLTDLQKQVKITQILKDDEVEIQNG